MTQKRLTGIEVFLPKESLRKRKQHSYLTQATIKRSSLISHGQVNLIKFVESNKFDKVYSKVWNIFVWSNFLKIWPVLFHQIRWMKNIKSNFKSPRRRKNEENETTNESARNIFAARFSFGVLASHRNIQGLSSSFHSFSSCNQHSERRVCN